MAILLHTAAADPRPWGDALAAVIPGLDVRIWPDIGWPEEIDVLLSWLPPEGILKQLPNLKLLQCWGAGIDQLAIADLPAGLPVARIVNADQTAGMVQYVLATVLRYHRQLDVYACQQAERTWKRLPHADARDRKIGVMGLGELGGASAKALAGLGFETSGWARRPKPLPGVATYAGPGQLPAFLKSLDILVCLLPLTRETENLIDARLLALLPKGAKLINASRGKLVVEADLVAALDAGQLGAATLDVAREEPLPEASPLWVHPAITLTPHVSTIVTQRGTIPGIAENIRRLHAGEPLLHLIDRKAGY